MALLALWAEPPGVHVVLGVAARANHGRLDHVLWLDVTLRATGFRVCPGEWKAGARRMIENPELPAVRVVTGSAIGTQRAFVGVLLGVTASAALRCLVEALVHVTLAAGDRNVQAEEGIARQVMVEGDVAPSNDGVTHIASLPDRAAMRIGGAVAAGAILTEFLLLHDTRVAHVAVEFGVSALEREIGSVIVRRHPPRFGGMAVTAHLAQTAGVAIIRLVAAGAVAWNRFVDIAAAMTVGAADVGMATEECEPGLPTVLELLRAPVCRGVTAATVAALTTLVDVIRHVTADAFLGNALVMLGGMASGAGRGLVFVGEGEGGLVMIKVRLLPRCCIVTGGALRAQGATVRVIFPVAIDAGRRSFAVGHVRAMTTSAG